MQTKKITQRTGWYDGWVIAVLLVVANLPLMKHGIPESLVFFPEYVAVGQWWRMVTYPLVHVSLYHLMLDAGAFLLLYSCLAGWRVTERIICLAICSVCSLGAAWLASPMQHGLCGLSGIAHGLMAVVALQMMRDQQPVMRWAGAISFCVVVLKSMIEGMSGQICFRFLHFGSVGQAVAVCHTGGVLGGIVAFWVIEKWRQITFCEDSGSVDLNCAVSRALVPPNMD